MAHKKAGTSTSNGRDSAGRRLGVKKSGGSRGDLISFDGVCDIDGNVVIAFNEHFTTPIAEVVNEKLDMYYYASIDMPGDFRKLGERVVKAFGISKRTQRVQNRWWD